MSQDEFADLAIVQSKVIKVIHDYFQTEKEYIFCFSEAPGFKHLHFHIVPKNQYFDPQYKGAKVFHYLKAPENEWIRPERVREICQDLTKAIENL